MVLLVFLLEHKFKADNNANVSIHKSDFVLSLSAYLKCSTFDGCKELLVDNGPRAHFARFTFDVLSPLEGGLVREGFGTPFGPKKAGLGIRPWHQALESGLVRLIKFAGN